ncbi:diaminobutyrate acetyltransferase [Leptospirillum ferriphilum]|uniref:L-2,4-diaminobutyric acid acetyltransferase n=2 Tax=Leptospirillum TaxID=179 RepID=A0A094WC86_9BACT|nr:MULTISPECIES: diaminobutyrate acetyltransferase [Leptospirillum]EDZ39436.1 MAG: L-2,4-diaminobutyric acid acetyltransferase [Leptospirillum sp. Group II '5-way CG']EIJ77005.1 MAG: L-2,4-diaminobutyric acid acetyltransferase [Leptospirillum sp. Group II 'C75']KGA95163.1 L-2,4-diaminobutyric acid acetyltransferase [Leptospirillum ferriphilum]
MDSKNISPACLDFQTPTRTEAERFFRFRTPTDLDGRSVHRLISRCPPLDANSVYANLLQCLHFSGTSILAETGDGQLAAFISGYVLPENPDTLFIWQVAVDPVHRGKGVALSMLDALLDRTIPAGVRYLETTISPENGPSRTLFQKLFSRRKAPFSKRPLFGRETHFGGGHDDEVLYRGGPFSAVGP